MNMNKKVFFNTTDLKGQELVTAISKAETQNERVFEIIKAVGKPVTPFGVHEIYCEIFSPCPVTSIRRSMTTLTDEGRLEMLDETVIEQYGAKNHLWTLKKYDQYEIRFE